MKGLPSGIQLFDNAQTPIETPPSIQHNEHTEQTERKQSNHEHHDGSVARQAGVNVGEATILADFTTGTDGFHHDDVLARAARAVADFFHGPASIVS